MPDLDQQYQKVSWHIQKYWGENNWTFSVFIPIQIIQAFEDSREGARDTSLYLNGKEIRKKTQEIIHKRILIILRNIVHAYLGQDISFGQGYFSNLRNSLCLKGICQGLAPIKKSIMNRGWYFQYVRFASPEDNNGFLHAKALQSTLSNYMHIPYWALPPSNLFRGHTYTCEISTPTFVSFLFSPRSSLTSTTSCEPSR